MSIEQWLQSVQVELDNAVKQTLASEKIDLKALFGNADNLKELGFKMGERSKILQGLKAQQPTVTFLGIFALFLPHLSRRTPLHTTHHTTPHTTHHAHAPHHAHHAHTMARRDTRHDNHATTP